MLENAENGIFYIHIRNYSLGKSFQDDFYLENLNWFEKISFNVFLWLSSGFLAIGFIAPTGRPRGLPRRRTIISCACTCVRVYVREIAGQYAEERGRKMHGESDLAVLY